MIEILTNNLFHALRTNNQKLLGYLIDDNCVYDDSKDESILGKEEVIFHLTQMSNGYEISILNSMKDNNNTVLLAYRLMKNHENQFGSLIVRHNGNKKINFLKNTIVAKS